MDDDYKSQKLFSCSAWKYRVHKSGNLDKASHKTFTYELPEQNTVQFLYKIQPDPLFGHCMIIIFTNSGPTNLNNEVIMLLWI